MQFDFNRYHAQLITLCTRYNVERLALFGSAARGEFAVRQSDLDFLVSFAPSEPAGAFARYFGLKEALEQLFDCTVDLVEERAIRNPYFKQSIVRDRILLYGTGS